MKHLKFPSPYLCNYSESYPCWYDVFHLMKLWHKVMEHPSYCDTNKESIHVIGRE
jgi:hypothetical protein